MKILVRSESRKSDVDAEQFARRLKLPYEEDDSEAEIVLWISDEQGLSLSLAQDNTIARLSLSFHSGALNHRRNYGGGRSQMIAKAIGIEKSVYPKVLDVTAGLGGDAFVLATLGAIVVGVEKNPVLFAFLEDAKCRAKQYAETNDTELQEILRRMEFTQADSCDYLVSKDCGAPEVIYLDPMFPERRKKAAVKKEMVILQKLLAEDTPNDELLLELALEKATHRVVVKRPRHAPPIAGASPQYALEGKSTRFDIYPLKSLKSKS